MQTVNLSFVREVIMSLQNAGFFGSALNWYMKSSLILLICIGMVLGVFLGVVAPSYAGSFSLLGDLFVGALKAIAPVLVFTLVCASVTNHEKGTETKIKPLIVLYLVSTFAAALIAVIASFMFPTTLQLQAAEAGEAVQTVSQVLKTWLCRLLRTRLRLFPKQTTSPSSFGLSLLVSVSSIVPIQPKNSLLIWDIPFPMS